MRKLLKMAAALLAAAAIVTTTAITAGAASYNAQADALQSMGLFRGTGNGYELDRTLTRVEAAAMLVRLLGKDAESQAGTYRHPFTDVPAWADKYIGYLYTNGLIKGTSATTFSSDVKCDTTMFTILVLRSLGYSEANGDYTYADALDYATETGLIDDATAEKSAFLRDDLVAISYSALFQKPRGSASSTLLDKLVSEHAVSQESADAAGNLYKQYKTIAAAGSASSLTLPAQLQQNATIQFSVYGQSDKVTVNTLYTIMKDGDKTLMKADSQTDGGSGVSNATSYYVNDWVYTNSDTGKYKYQTTPLNLDNLLVGINNIPFYEVRSITNTGDSTGPSYIIVFEPGAYDSLSESISEMLGTDISAGIQITINSAQLAVSLDNAGKLRSEKFDLDLTANYTDSGMTVPIGMTMTVNTDVVSAGGNAAFTLPADLDTYPEQ